MTFDPDCPVVQGPMAGGTTTPALVAAVSGAGAIGAFGAAYMTADAIRGACAAVRDVTDRPFAVNLFAGGDPGRAATVADAEANAMLDILGRHHETLSLQRPRLPGWPEDPFDAQFAALLDAGAPIFSFTFGIRTDAVAEARRRGLDVWGTATSVAEAVLLEQAGVTAVVAQGFEAGGHRGTFAGPFEAAMIGTMALVPQVVDAVALPVIASGGIMDGRGIAAALALGATAVQMGSAFLTTTESGAPEAHKRALLNGREDQTRVTRAFSGRPARGLGNAFMDEVDAAGAALPYPLQNALTRPMRAEAARQGDPDRLSLWAGQGLRLGRAMPAADLVAALTRELADARSRLAL